MFSLLRLKFHLEVLNVEIVFAALGILNLHKLLLSFKMMTKRSQVLEKSCTFRGTSDECDIMPRCGTRAIIVMAEYYNMPGELLFGNVITRVSTTATSRTCVRTTCNDNGWHSGCVRASSHCTAFLCSDVFVPFAQLNHEHKSQRKNHFI